MRLTVLFLSVFFVLSLSAQNEKHIVFQKDVNDNIATCLGHPIKGNVKSITLSGDGSWSLQYDFDKLGRLVYTSYKQSNKLMKYSKFKYDKSGNAIKKEYMDNGYKSVVTFTFDQYGNMLTRTTKEDGFKETVGFTYDFDKRKILAKSSQEEYPKRNYFFDENGYVYSCENYPSERKKRTEIYTYDDQQRLCKELSITESNGVYGQTVDSVQVNYTFTPEGFWSQKEIIRSSKRVDKDKNGNFMDPVFDVVKDTTLYIDIKKDDEGNVIEYKEKDPKGKILVKRRSIVYY